METVFGGHCVHMTRTMAWKVYGMDGTFPMERNAKGNWMASLRIAELGELK